MAASLTSLRPVRWIGSTRKDISDLPESVRAAFGFALFLAQSGQRPLNAKLLKGLGSGVVELVESSDGDAYRAVYTVRFEKAVYVLHCFKKKSKSGIKTPLADIELIRRRLRDAEVDYAARQTGE